MARRRHSLLQGAGHPIATHGHAILVVPLTSKVGTHRSGVYTRLDRPPLSFRRDWAHERRGAVIALSLPQVPATLALPQNGPKRASFAPISATQPRLAPRSRDKPTLRSSRCGRGGGWAPGGRRAPANARPLARGRADFEHGAQGHAAATARAPSAIFREHPIEDLAPGRPEALAFQRLLLPPQPREASRRSCLAGGLCDHRRPRGRVPGGYPAVDDRTRPGRRDQHHQPGDEQATRLGQRQHELPCANRREALGPPQGALRRPAPAQDGQQPCPLHAPSGVLMRRSSRMGPPAMGILSGWVTQ